MKILTLTDAPEHIPQLAAWHHNQWSYLNPAGSLESRIERMRTHLADQLIPSTFIAVADDIAKAEGLLGSAAIVASDMDTHPELTPWLASVFVDPVHRNKGAGAALVNYVVERARDADIKALYLFTPDRESFYRSLGWETLSREIYRGSAVTIMRIALQ